MWNDCWNYCTVRNVLCCSKWQHVLLGPETRTRWYSPVVLTPSWSRHSSSAAAGIQAGCSESCTRQVSSHVGESRTEHGTGCTRRWKWGQRGIPWWLVGKEDKRWGKCQCAFYLVSSLMSCHTEETLSSLLPWLKRKKRCIWLICVQLVLLQNWFFLSKATFCHFNWIPVLWWEDIE